jgi:prepilin-type N-terminal cleavage/methylation domain-containing protein
MRKAFTLIEILIAITILSIMMLFLYQSYSSLNISNSFYKNELGQIKNDYLKKKVFFLDFSLVYKETAKILNQDTKQDVVFLQSSHSIHKRHNPYIAYIIQDSKLYRLESIQEFNEYPLSVGGEYVADCLGEIDSFRVYRSKDDEGSFLVHADFKKDEDILLKIKALQE